MTARGARGIAIAALGAAFVLRAVGDTGPAGLSWLSWASPLGWAELTRPFGSAGQRWWVLALPLAAFPVLVAVAFLLAARRDHGAGLLPDQPGRPAASGFLRGPFSLAWRLERGVLVGWIAGYVLAFAAFGAAAKGFTSFLSTSPALKTVVLRLGYQAILVDAFLSTFMPWQVLASPYTRHRQCSACEPRRPGTSPNRHWRRQPGGPGGHSATYPSRWAVRASSSPRQGCQPA